MFRSCSVFLTFLILSVKKMNCPIKHFISKPQNTQNLHQKKINKQLIHTTHEKIMKTEFIFKS